MGRKKNSKSSNKNRPHPLNLLYAIYDHNVDPVVPQEYFSITEEELTCFESVLGGVSLANQKHMLEFVCRSFINTVAFQAHRASKLDLAVYARDLAETCDRLVGLLREPQKVSVLKGVRGQQNYRLVHNVLMSNWQITRPRIAQEQLSLLADQVETLAKDALRISADHAPARFNGKHPDLGLNYLLLYLHSIAAGVIEEKVTLPGNEDLGYSTELRDFALAVLEFAIRRGKRGIDSLDLPEQVRTDAHAAMNQYSEEMNPTRLLRFSENWFVKPTEKREGRRKKANKATSHAV
jgi:hypothetical protein